MNARSIPAHDGPPVRSAFPPNQTIYITNLPDKLRKNDTRHSLYTLCSTYGPVLDVVAMPRNKMRGQAWVAFRDVQASTQAMRSLQDFDFFGNQLKIQYAKAKSDTIAKLDGSYRMPSTSATLATTSTELQQQIFGGVPAKLPPVPPAASQKGGDSHKDDGLGIKRGREEESDDEEAAMDEDSDAPMEEASDDDDDE